MYFHLLGASVGQVDVVRSLGVVSVALLLLTEFVVVFVHLPIELVFGGPVALLLLVVTAGSFVGSDDDGHEGEEKGDLQDGMELYRKKMIAYAICTNICWYDILF